MKLAPGSLRKFYFDGKDNEHIYILADAYNFLFQWMDTATNTPYPGLSKVICTPWDLQDFLNARPQPLNTPRPCGTRVKRWILQ